MTVIYIRHGNDKQDEPRYKNDPQLVPEATNDIHKLTQYLIRKYGMPDIICVSPMSRAIETCKYMTGHFEEASIRICPDLSRFFARSESTDLAPRTFKLRVPLGETKDDFTKRVHHHVSFFAKKGFYHHRRPLIWCITHALVMKRVATKLNLSLEDHLRFLHYFVV